MKKTTKSSKPSWKLTFTASGLQGDGVKSDKRGGLETYNMTGQKYLWRRPWRRHPLATPRPSLVNSKRDGQEIFVLDGVRLGSRQYERILEAGWRRHKLKRDTIRPNTLYIVFIVFMHKCVGILARTFINPSTNFVPFLRVSNPWIFHVQLKISIPLIIQYVYVLFDSILRLSFN